MDARTHVADWAAAHPLAHAALVHDLVHDRTGLPRRGLDPMILARHREMVLRDLTEVVTTLAADGLGVSAAAQQAVSHAIHIAHQDLVRLGHLATDGDAGALAGGRMLFAAAMAPAFTEACLQSV